MCFCEEGAMLPSTGGKERHGYGEAERAMETAGEREVTTILPTDKRDKVLIKILRQERSALFLCEGACDVERREGTIEGVYAVKISRAL